MKRKKTKSIKLVAQLEIQADVFAVSDTVIWPMCALAILNAVLLSRTYVLSLQRTGSASSLYTLFRSLYLVQTVL